jgi:hypothetical protein
MVSGAPIMNFQPPIIVSTPLVDRFDFDHNPTFRYMMGKH